MGSSPINERTVELWWIDIPSQARHVTELETVLSSDELARGSRLHFARDRERFIVARAGLRHILSQYECRAGSLLKFSTGNRGKPFLQHTTSLRFNLSHSDDIALVAVSHGQEVGVDVEKIKSLPDLPAMAERAFFEEELQNWRSLRNEASVREFYRIWTRGEAFLKWQGCGLVEPEERRQMLQTFSGFLQEIEAPAGYACALATTRNDVQLTHHTWSYAQRRVVLSNATAIC